MAGINPVPTENFGNLLTSFPQGMASAAQGQASAGLMQAQVPLVQQQTIGANIANQRSAFELNMMRQFMMQSQAQDMNSGKENESGVDPSEQGIQHTASMRFQAADPMGTPQDQAMLKAASFNPQLRQTMEAQRDKNVQGENIRRQASANEAFEAGYGATNSDAPMAYLARSQNPFVQNVVAAIKSQYPKEQWDEQAKTQAGNIAKYTHQYTGRETEYNPANEPVDKATKFPLGLPTPGLKPQEDIAGLERAHATVERYVNGAITKEEQYQADGFKTAEAWWNAVKAGIFTPQNKPVSTPTKGQAPVQAPASAQAPAGGAVGSPAARGGPTVQPPMAGLSKEQMDFINKSPALPPEMNTGNRAPTPGETKVQQDVGTARGTLLTSATQGLQSANSTIANVARVQHMIDQPHLMLGPGSEGWSNVQTMVQNWGPRWLANAVGDPSNRQVLQKYLSTDQLNAILKEFHAEGAQVRLGAYETRAIMNYMSANPNLAKQAIQQMIDWERSDAVYNQGKSRTAIGYVNARRDPSQFAYEGTFPRPTIEKPGANARTIVTDPGADGYKGTSRSGKPYTMVGGRPVYD